jgi:hypothetical protein
MEAFVEQPSPQLLLEKYMTVWRLHGEWLRWAIRKATSFYNVGADDSR